MLALVAGAVAGVLSGMGIGGGTLLMIYMINLAGVEQLAAQGINLLYFLPTAAASLVFHIKNRLVDLRAFLFCAIPGTVFAILGSLLANAADAGLLRRLFGGLLAAAGAAQLFGRKKGAKADKNCKNTR